MNNVGEQKSMFGPPFPIYIEVDVENNPDQPAFSQSIFQKLDRYQYLASLCIRDIFPMYPGYLSQEKIWVSEWNTETSTYEHHLAQSSFGTIEEASFSRYEREGGSPNTFYQEYTHYNDAILSINGVLTPPYIDDFFSRFDQLEETQKNNIVRSAFWFCQAESISRLGGAPSGSYVTAIECLLDKNPVDKCRQCKQDIYSVTKRFKEFMGKYAKVSNEVLPLRDQIYNSRSDNVHGRFVSKVDALPFKGKYDSDPILFTWLIRKALVNWVLQTPNSK